MAVAIAASSSEKTVAQRRGVSGVLSAGNFGPVIILGHFLAFNQDNRQSFADFEFALANDENVCAVLALAAHYLTWYVLAFLEAE